MKLRGSALGGPMSANETALRPQDRSLRILHLEDNRLDAAMILDRLLAGGVLCDVMRVDTQDRFESALGAGGVDLIISDYTLPSYDGISALKFAQSRCPDVPVILVSGTVGEEKAVQCLQFGATDYLLKARLERLVPAVRRALEEAEARRGRLAAEAALSESETRKAAILDSVLDSIITMDARGVVIEFNTAAVRTFGYTKDQAIGQSLATLIIPPAFRAMHAAGLARYLATANAALIGRLIEVTAVRSDGSEIPVELAITAIGSGPTPVFTGVLRDITSRRQADAVRTQLAAIVDSSDDAIVSMSVDETILTWNAGAERLYGYTAAEIVGQSRQILVPEALRSGLVPLLERVARERPRQPLETQRRRKDGSLVEISVVTSPIVDASGTLTGVSTIARDITQQRHAAAAVRLERDAAQGYLDAAEVMLLKLDLQGRITLVNRYACSILGWTADELLGKDWIEQCMPPRVRGEMRRQVCEVLAGGATISEHPILTKSGRERLIEWRSVALTDDGGLPAGTLSSGTDITDRSLAAEALRQTEERMRFALQGADVGIWDLDYVTGALSWSEILEKQYCITPGTFAGTFESFVGLVHPDDRASLVDAMGRAMKSGGDFTTLHRVICPDGSVRWLSGAGRVHLNDQGAPVRAVGISLDLTARHVLEEQYQQAQKMEAVGRLAAGVAHDFNNLLTVILGFCGLLMSGLDPGDPRQSDLLEIQSAGGRAADLTRQLLAFSRKEVIQPTVLDLNDIVGQIHRMLGRLIGEDVAVVVDLSPEPALVKADRGQVEQIVLNLAVNARDAMPDGGTLTIRTATVGGPFDAGAQMKHEPAVLLTVSDTGTGMTPEVKARLFEPFFTTKGVGKGTGLGLATVQGVVLQSGGHVSVESELGSGTTFKVFFPRVQAAELATVDLAPSSEAGSMRQTVLVVEDEAALRELTKRLLERMGYAVLTASTAEEAVLMFDTHPAIDLLLTDVVMPGASGPALVVQLVERQPSLKVVYMSGYTDDAIGHHGVLAAGITFLHKPFTSESLGAKLREALEQT